MAGIEVSSVGQVGTGAWAVALIVAACAAGASELPPEIAVDRLLVRAEWQAEEGEHGAAFATLNEVLSLVEEHGLATPDAFWFRDAQAASTAGEHERAVESATRYVTTAGRAGEHYRAALELLEASDREVQALREREAAERALRERRQPAESRAQAAYRSLREGLTAAPAGDGIFADALQAGGYGPAMVTIPAGEFRMGCLWNYHDRSDVGLIDDDGCYGDEKPVHKVTIGRPFALSVYEVTFAEWDACVAAGGCGGYGDWSWGRGARPLMHVSWDDAQRYVAWLSAQTGAAYRLPSESEWEYAARAGTTTRYVLGDEIGRNRANCDGCGSQWDDGRTAPVGSFAANPWGLYDMHGNVYEWVADCWNGSYTGAPSDGSAWLEANCSAGVVRGGSWYEHPRNLRAADRLRDTRYVLSGFRVARTLTP